MCGNFGVQSQVSNLANLMVSKGSTGNFAEVQDKQTNWSQGKEGEL